MFRTIKKIILNPIIPTSIFKLKIIRLSGQPKEEMSSHKKKKSKTNKI